MCLAFPGKIVKMNGDKSIVSFDGVEREIITSLVEVKEGDMVLVHAGLAIEKINKNKNGN